MAPVSGYTVAGESKVSKPGPTIREHLDRRIEVARNNVEELCITKAKLEALNVLDHPLDLYEHVMF